MTVYSFAPTDRATAAPAGSTWQAADIEFCLSPTVESEVKVANVGYEFGLETASGKVLRPDSTEVAPKEIYSDLDRTIVANDCVRGNAVFQVPDDDPARYVGLFVGLGNRRWAVARAP